MPLYLDDAVLPPMPGVFMQVLLDCNVAIDQEPVNPAMLIGLLRRLLWPLLPDVHKPLLEIQGQTSWDSIWLLYSNLAYASGGTDKQLLASATLVGILARHTTRPPREVEFPAHLEVASFARIATLLGLPMADPSLFGQEKETPLFSFCRYCWLPQSSRGVCECHSTGSRQVLQDGLPLCAQITYKQVQRLRPAFEKNLTRLVSAEEWQFHESEFGAAVLLPPSGLEIWLKERRPALAKLVNGVAQTAEIRPLSLLLGVLYGNRGPNVAKAIGGAMYLLTPVTARAEAWLSAWEGRGSWGGHRAGAGRRSVPAGSKDPEQDWQ